MDLVSSLTEQFWHWFPRAFEPIQDFFNGNFYEVLEQYLQPYPHQRVLDLGCGVGSLANRLHCQNYVGVDIDPAFIKLARQLYQRQRNIKFVCADALKYTPSQSFDLVIASSMTHHLSDKQFQQLLNHLAKNVTFKYLIIIDGMPYKRIWKPLLMLFDVGANFREVETVVPFFDNHYTIVASGVLTANQPWYYYPFVLAQKRKKS